MKTCKCGLCGKEVDSWMHITTQIRGEDTLPVHERDLCLECALRMLLKCAEYEVEKQKEETK